jgi:hypothetical protein
MTPLRYDEMRAIPVRFVVVPSHEATLLERVVYRSESFTIVRKIGIAAEVARELSGSSA